MRMRKKWRVQPAEAAAFEAGGSPQPPLAGDGTPTGAGEAGKAQSHLGEVGNNQANQGDGRWMGAVGEAGMGTQMTDGWFAAPGAPTGGSPSSASLVWGAEQEVRKNPSKENR